MGRSGNHDASLLAGAKIWAALAQGSMTECTILALDVRACARHYIRNWLYHYSNPKPRSSHQDIPPLTNRLHCLPPFPPNQVTMPIEIPPSSVNKETDLLVITCASGKQASALLPIVSKEWRRLRLVCHSPQSEQRLKQQYPNAEVIATDLGLPKEPERILKDATVIYHVEPPFAHRQAVMGFNMIDAAVEEAKKGTFKHFVYASVLNPQLRKVSFPLTQQPSSNRYRKKKEKRKEEEEQNTP